MLHSLAVAEQIHDYVTTRRADGALVDRLRGLSPEAIAAVESMIVIAQPSASTLRVILQHANDIARREQCAVSEVLASDEVLEILRRENSNPKAKQRLLREHFERLHFPLLTRIRAIIDTSVRAVLTRYHLKIEVPTDLQGDMVSITLQFRDVEELRHHADRLSQLAGDPELKKILALLRGDETN